MAKFCPLYYINSKNIRYLSCIYIWVCVTSAITNGEEETDREKYEFCPVLQRLQDDYHFMSEYLISGY